MGFNSELKGLNVLTKFSSVTQGTDRLSARLTPHRICRAIFFILSSGCTFEKYNTCDIFSLCYMTCYHKQILLSEFMVRLFSIHKRFPYLILFFPSKSKAEWQHFAICFTRWSCQSHAQTPSWRTKQYRLSAGTFGFHWYVERKPIIGATKIFLWVGQG